MIGVGSAVKPASGVNTNSSVPATYAHVPSFATTRILSTPGVLGSKSTATVAGVAGVPSLKVSLAKMLIAADASVVVFPELPSLSATGGTSV